jgi:hypothetical protein
MALAGTKPIPRSSSNGKKKGRAAVSAIRSQSHSAGSPVAGKQVRPGVGGRG